MLEMGLEYHISLSWYTFFAKGNTSFGNPCGSGIDINSLRPIHMSTAHITFDHISSIHLPKTKVKEWYNVYMTVRTIEYLLNKFGAGKSPGSSEYVDLIDTLADDRNAVYFSATAPADTEANPLWFNTTTNVLSVYDGEWFVAGGAQGPTGETGATGATGATGPGVATGGTTGQYLTKVDGTNYNTQWSTLDLSGKQDVVANVSSTEIGYLDGVTSAIQTQLNDKAPINAPTFTGIPSAPTASQGNNTTQIATTAYVDTAVSNIIDTAPATLNTLNELAAAINDDASFASTVTTALGTKAPLADPTFTGTVSGVTKSHVGLGNVDNTSDANKPVSTAQQTALDLKANLAGPTFTGTVVLPSTTSIGNVTSTEIGYVDGVTSAIQTQINSKASTGKAIAMAIVFGG